MKTQLALPGHAIGELRAMGTANHGGVSALSLNFPTAAALDAQGNLHIADNSNHRVLEFDRPLPLLGLFLPLLRR